MVQGAARDLFADSLLRIANAGLASRLWLVVHDEVIVSVPACEAEVVAGQVKDLLSDDFLGIPITAEAKILGGRWGRESAQPPPGGQNRVETDQETASARCRPTPSGGCASREQFGLRSSLRV